MATGMDDFGIFFSDSLGGGGPGQGEGDLSLLKRRFREFLREFRDNDSAYVYRNELERAVTVKTNSVTVNLGDISAYDPSLAEQIKTRPTTTFEILEEAAKVKKIFNSLKSAKHIFIMKLFKSTRKSIR